jgi:crossover junction endodeoxyribonuclease RuvC
MLVLGIDPGTATTGFGLVRETADGSLVAVDYGVITTPAGMPLPERLLVLYQQIRDIMLLHHPDNGAVEKLYFQRNVTTAFAVGQARGVVLLAMAQEKVPVAEYAPLEVKQAVVGYGVAEKRQVQEMVKAILLLDKIPRPDDAADALAIAITHLHSARYLNAGM